MIYSLSPNALAKFCHKVYIQKSGSPCLASSWKSLYQRLFLPKAYIGGREVDKVGIRVSPFWLWEDVKEYWMNNWTKLS